jgi:hypothetical protein
VGWSEGDGQAWMERRPTRMNPRPWARKRADKECPMGRPRPCGEKGSAYSNSSAWRVGLTRVTLRK